MGDPRQRSGRASRFFEPWRLTRDTTWESEFRFGPPQVSEYRTADDVRAWHTARAKAEAQAPATIWGSDMTEPMDCVSLVTQRRSVLDGDRVIGSFRPNRFAGPSHVELAGRAVACVNACRGIDDPVKTIAEIRAVVALALRGECDAEPGLRRVLALLGNNPSPVEID